MLIDFLDQGGPVMWVLLGCSVVGLGLILERLVFWILESRRVDLDGLEDFFELIHRGEFQEARDRAENTQNELLDRLVTVWETEGRRALVEAFDLMINRIEERSRRYLFALKTVVSVSPLLGILGTVIGIIQSFEVLGSAGSVADPQAVGAGLAQALITTAFGLIIAVPCLIAHNYFLAKSKKYVRRLDSFADELVYHLGDESEEPAARPDLEGQSASSEELREEMHS